MRRHPFTCPQGDRPACGTSHWILGCAVFADAKANGDNECAGETAVHWDGQVNASDWFGMADVGVLTLRCQGGQE